MILLRGVLRGLLRAPSRLVGLAALIAVATAVYAGTFMALDRLETTTERIYRELGLADQVLQFAPIDASRLPADLQVPGVAAWSLRLVSPGVLTLPDGSAASAVVLAVDMRSPPTVGAPALVSGAWLAKLEDGLIDTTFAADRGVAPGDTVRLRIGADRAELHIAGTMVHPEFLMASVDDHFTMPLRRTVGLLLVPRQRVLAARGSDVVNQLALSLTPGADPTAVVAAVTAKLTAAGATMQGVMAQQELYSVYCHWNRLVGFRDFLPTVIGLFDALAALSAGLLVRAAAHRARREIGTLLAIGVSPAAIAASWVGAIQVVALPGLVAGGLGAWGLAVAVYGAYADSTGFPVLDGSFPVWPLFAAVGTAAVLLVPATLFPLRVLLRQSPGALLRELPANPGWRLPAALRRLPLPERLGIALLLRRPGRTLAAAACIAGTQVMALSLWTFADGLGVGMARYVASQSWDLQVDLWSPQPAAELEALASQAGARAWTPVATVPAALGPAQQGVTLIGLPAGVRGEHDLVAGRLPAAPGEIAVTLRQAQAWGLEPGAPLSARWGGADHPLVISGIVNNYLLNVAFVDPSALPGDRYNTLLLSAPQTPSALTDLPLVARLLPQAELGRAATEVLAVLLLFLRAYALMGGLVGAALLWTTLRVEVQDAEGSFAVLTAIGWSQSALRRVLWVQALALALVSTVLAIPSNRISLLIFQERLARINVWVDVSTAGRAELLQLGPAIVLIGLSVIPALRLVARISVVRVLGRA